MLLLPTVSLTNFANVNDQLNAPYESSQKIDIAGSAITNGREPRSCLGRVFNSKLGHSATLGSKCMLGMQHLLKLKTRPKARPVS